MQITHYGHSCVLLDSGAARLLIDPGAFSDGFDGLTGLDAVLVTHQHVDHLDVDRLTGLLSANPSARLIVDSDTAAQLADGTGIDHEVTAPGAQLQVAGAAVDVLGGTHAVIHPDIPVISNNAYLVDGTHLHPGDSFPVTSAEVEVLFLPTAAPWLKLSDSVDYLRQVNPRTAVPIHEALLSKPGVFYTHFTNLAPDGTEVQVLDREKPVSL